MAETEDWKAYHGRRYLASSLLRRAPTYEVAHHVLGLDKTAGVLSPSLRAQLVRLGRDRDWYLPGDFPAVVSATRQLATFGVLFPTTAAATDPGDADALRRVVALGCGFLGFDLNVLATRDRDRARLSGSELKRLRFLRRLDAKADRVEEQWRLRHAMMQAKSRLAYRIDPTNLSDPALMFVAYLAARANRRTIFMVGEQSRARDEIVDGLIDTIPPGNKTDWEQVALVMPTKRVIARLDPEQRGRLISTFHHEMVVAARELEKLWPSLPVRMRKEMVVVRGVDSSRWNAYAGALNTMRAAWISAVLAAGLDEILDRYLPGKAPRLMASDVAWMYRNAGRDLHEDTRMFTTLAKPWDVVNGTVPQRRGDISAAGAANNINTLETGWVGPRAPVEAELPEPEPSLVHGVVVTDPELARTLRRCGVFSGKTLQRIDELLDVERGISVRSDGALTPFVAPAASTITGNPISDRL